MHPRAPHARNERIVGVVAVAIPVLITIVGWSMFGHWVAGPVQPPATPRVAGAAETSPAAACAARTPVAARSTDRQNIRSHPTDADSRGTNTDSGGGGDGRSGTGRRDARQRSWRGSINLFIRSCRVTSSTRQPSYGAPACAQP